MGQAVLEESAARLSHGVNKRTNNGTPTTFGVNVKNELVNVGTDTCTYDNNGNLTYCGAVGNWQRYFTYDDENQLASAQAVGYGYYTYTYDGRGRPCPVRFASKRPCQVALSRGIGRQEEKWDAELSHGVNKRVGYTWTGSSWTPNSTNYYVYDGMRVIQERDHLNTPTVAYTRGNDLSGSMEGAGGIGGMLARSHGYSGGAFSTHSFYHADGNGNITYLANSSQAMVANYRYDPYGNTLYSGGTLASANTYRFSSKPAMDIPSLTLYYYGYRFYDPNLQRWLNRDPIFEKRGINLYTYARNSPVAYSDFLGLTLYKCTRQAKFPLEGAQHVYLYDDKSGKGCGEGGNFWCQRGVDNPEDRGPGTRGHRCVPVRGADGQEDAVINTCMNKKTHVYIPVLHDCHGFLRGVLAAQGLTDPEILGRYYGPIDALRDYCATYPGSLVCWSLKINPW